MAKMMMMTGISSLQQSAPAAATAASTANRVWPRSKVVQDRDKQEHREKEHEDVVPEEAGEVDHVRRYGDEERGNQHLVFTDIPDPVNCIHQRDDHEAEERREQPGCKVGWPDQGKHTRGD